MKLITKANNIFDRILNLMALLAVILLIFLMVSVTYEIVIRYFLNSTTMGLFEFWTYSVLYITFLSAAWVLKGEGHVEMDIMVKRLKPRTQAMVNIITSSIGAVVFLLISWYGAQITWEFIQSGALRPTLLRIPKWPTTIIIPVGTFLFFIQLLRRTHGFWVKWRTAGAGIIDEL